MRLAPDAFPAVELSVREAATMLERLRTTVRQGRFAVRSTVFRVATMAGSSRYNSYKKFLILTRPRTGSNMLVSLLSSHPSIVARGELLAKLNGRDLDDLTDNVLSEIFRLYPRHIKAVGFKFMYNHPFDAPARNAEIWRKLRTIEGLEIIHLKRRNTLRSDVSNKIAREKTGQWKGASKAVPVEQRRVSFTPAELLAGFERTRDWEEKFDRELRGIPHLEVFYEDIATAPQEQLARIGAFLDVKPGRFHTALQRQNPESLAELVTNYQELKQGLADTEWARFFDD